MQALRQLGGGVIIAIFSVILVIGGIFLSLAETLPPPATSTQIPPTLPLSFPTPTPTATTTHIPTLQSETPTETASLPPTAILSSPTACNPPPGWIQIVTGTGDTIYDLAQRYKTSTENLSAANCLTTADLPGGFVLYVPPVPTVTVIPCGPPAGWVRAYIVRPGDNLYRIALSYGITFQQLQRGNCMGSSTTIYVGQRLWVPNIPTRTTVPGVTIIPDFPTATASPTATTVPPTDTATFIPTATNTATQPPTSTQTLASPPPP